MVSITAAVPRQGLVEMQAAPEEARRPLADFRQKASYVIAQRVIMSQLRKGLACHSRGEAAFAGFLRRARAWHDRYDGVLPSLEVDATWSEAPDFVAPAPPTRADWFAPRDKAPRGTVFYVHGGSFVAERSPRIGQLVGRFAAAAEASVYAPSYRLAPEHPCPAAVEDIIEAWRWQQRHRPNEPVVALAESAGAAIMMAAFQVIRDRGEPMPAGIVLLSPWLDLSLQSWSVMAASIAKTSPHTMESLAMFAHFYLQGRSAIEPIASPLFGSFHGFPPLLVHASKTDILYDDSMRLADRVRDAGGDLTLRHWADETHFWERMNTPKARQSIELAAGFIRRRLDAAAARAQ